MKTRFIRKISSLVIAVVMMTCLAMPSLATSSEPMVTVTYGDEVLWEVSAGDVDGGIGAVGIAPLAASSKDYDLSEGSKTLNQTNIDAGKVRQSTFNYRTTSTKIIIKMKSSESSSSVRVRLYDSSDDKMILESTVTLGKTLNTTVTFSNLTSSRKYYIKWENLGQVPIDITGTISQ